MGPGTDLRSALWDTCYRHGRLVNRNRAALRSLAGTYVGHTRTLRINRNGTAHAVVYDGCCSEVSSIDYVLGDLARRGRRWIGTATITRVRHADPDVYDPLPAEGDRSRFRKVDDVVLVDRITYCGPDAAAGSCGA